MKYLIAFVTGAMLLTTVYCTSGPYLESASMDSLPVNAVRCGAKLTSTASQISYKPFEIAEPNERCVWVIRAVNGTSANITLIDLDTPDSVSVFGLGRPGLRTEWTPSGSGDSVLLDNTNVVVVTFHTSGNSTALGRGFQLSYAIFTNGTNAKANSTSEDVIHAEDIGHIKYPASAANYGDSELSVFIFAPFYNHFDLASELKLIYIETSLENTRDYVEVYSFQKTWKLLGRVSSKVEGIRGHDIIMLVFESDNSITHAGFQVAYSQSSRGSCSS